MRKLTLIYKGLFLLFLLSCKKDEPCLHEINTATEEILMQNTIFIPSEKTITIGTTVKWINKDPYAHTVTSSENKFDSGNMNEGQIFEYKFDTAGTFDYYCVYHLPGMKGKIIVK